MCHGGEHVDVAFRADDRSTLIGDTIEKPADRQKRIALERAKRSIEQQETWAGDERLRQSDAMNLAGGEPRDAGIGAVRESGALDHLGDAPSTFRGAELVERRVVLE